MLHFLKKCFIVILGGYVSNIHSRILKYYFLALINAFYIGLNFFFPL